MERLFCIPVDVSAQGFTGEVADEPEPVLRIFVAIMGYAEAEGLVRSFSSDGFKEVNVERRIE